MNLCSAGILLFRSGPAGAEVLLGHPGGPLWRHKDEGAWSIPKGLCRQGEAPLLAAQREFREETGFEPGEALLELGAVRQTSGKLVHVWASAGDADPEQMMSNTFLLEWPPRSGRVRHYPELDRVAWFDLQTACCKIHKGQAPFIERLERLLQDKR
jgi:predicted NUDIX family NTP pyrophosphohydrolase